jgi:hypothetical protein
MHMNRKIFLTGMLFIGGAIILLTSCTSTPTPTKPAASPVPEIVVTPTDVMPTPAPATTTSRTYLILANLGWDSVGMYVRPGQQFEISATGSWSNGPEGNPIGPAGGDGFDPASILPSAPIGTLIGRIGYNQPFEVGEHALLTADYGGELYLRMNDDPGALSDNTGSLEVTVALGPRPDTPTQVLTNELDGYRLLVPVGYQAVIYQNGMCLTKSEAWMMACHVANALIEVSDAAGRSLSQVADEAAAQGNPDIPVRRTELVVSGVEAIQLDDIYTYDVLRKVVMVSEDRVYILTFLPWSEKVEDFARLEELYNTVIGSFTILPSLDAALPSPAESSLRPITSTLDLASGAMNTDQALTEAITLATQQLQDFLNSLSWGDDNQLEFHNYERAAELYGGSYEILQTMNPDVDPDDHLTLLRHACEGNGFQCQRLREVLSITLETGEDGLPAIVFTVNLMNPDGSLFSLGPCCGEDPSGEPQTEFIFTVKQVAEGEYKVFDLPPYMP